MKKPLAFLAPYTITLAGAVAFLILIMRFGSHQDLTVTKQNLASSNALDWLLVVGSELTKNLSAPIAGLLIQILAILIASRLCAALLKKMGQPQVIGEMIAGVILGKSVLGIIWPNGFAVLFPESSMPRLYFLSQIGLIFFMFVVGIDLKVSDFKNRASSAVLVSHVSIVLPFLLGALVSLGIYNQFGPPNIAFSSFALFMGIAMSITAFPVLARIIQEKGLTDTSLGKMAIACAAIDDVTAWCVLAAVLGIVKTGSAFNAAAVIMLSILFVGIMFKVVKPLLQRSFQKENSEVTLSNAQLASIFCIVISSALISEIIGIHVLFGAFLAGVIMPEQIQFRSALKQRVEIFSSVILLPIFFAYTGIRTQIDLISNLESLTLCLFIILIAVVGKLVGSALAARWSKMSWRDSWSIGALMNTRGLMELVVLNIGYDLGILPPTIFTIMVVMALVTTIMTGPLLNLINPKLTT